MVFVVYNERALMPSFLAHHRRIGVTRFVCVDDNSTDGTREYLATQTDVDVFESKLSYRDAQRSIAWRHALFRLYGMGRWYLNVDADEFFVYPGWRERGLNDFIAALTRRGEWHCSSILLDAYPDGPIDAAHFTDDGNAMPWDVAPMIDGCGYMIGRKSEGITLYGGPRYRMTKVGHELVKFPLIYVRNPINRFRSIHKPSPFQFNFSPFRAALLHFKFMSGFLERARSAVARGQHHQGAHFYDLLLGSEAASEGASLTYDGSIELDKSAVLQDHFGFERIV